VAPAEDQPENRLLLRRILRIQVEASVTIPRTVASRASCARSALRIRSLGEPR
jgi:hypothetical protein